MTVQDLFKQININGFRMGPEAVKANEIKIVLSEAKTYPVKMESKLS